MIHFARFSQNKNGILLAKPSSPFFVNQESTPAVVVHRHFTMQLQQPHQMGFFGRLFGRGRMDTQEAFAATLGYQKQVDDWMREQLSSAAAPADPNLVYEALREKWNELDQKIEFLQDERSKLFWEFSKKRVLANLCFQFADAEGALRYCNEALGMEKEIEKVGLLDHLFLWFVHLSRTKSEILMSQNKSEEALTILSDWIGRVKHRVSNEKDSQKRNILFDVQSTLLFRRACIYFEKEQLHDSMMDLDESNRLVKQSTTYLLKAEICFKRSEYSEAEHYANKAIELNTDESAVSSARILIAKCMLETGRASEGADLCTRIIELQNGRNAEAFAMRAECYSNLHRYEDALRDCQQAENIDPMFTLQLIEWHANALNRLARYDELISYITKLTHIIHDLDLPSQYEEMARTIQNMAQIDKLLLEKKYSEALDKAETIKTDEESPALLSRMVEVYIHNGKFNEALDVANKCLSMPELTWEEKIESLENRAVALAHLKKFSEAFADLDAAQKMLQEAEHVDNMLKEELLAWHKYSRARVMISQNGRTEESLRLLQEASQYATQYCLEDMRAAIVNTTSELENENK